MQLKKILKAAFRIRNLAILAGVVIVSYLTEFVPFMFIGAAGYLYFVLQTLKDGAFIKEYSEDEKIDNIRDLNIKCNNLLQQSRKEIDREFNGNIRNIMKDKDEIMALFSGDEEDYVKQKVVEQAVNLVIAYISLLVDYCRRRRRVAAFDTNEIVFRINSNERKLQYLKDSQASGDIRQAVEMDKKILENIDQEKRELERAGARLTFIESTLKSFKQQTIASDNTDEITHEIENIINESTALDNVLNSDKDDRLKFNA